MNESLNLWLCLFAIARFLAMTMLGPALVILVIYEQVSGRAVSHNTRLVRPSCEGNKPARKKSPDILRRAA